MAAPNSNMLLLPFKRTHAISLAEALKQYISSKYDQHPDMFTQDLEKIDELRKGAVNHADPHPSGIIRIQSYAAQLVWMGSKFPIDVGVDFVWYPSIGYETDSPVSHNNIRYELANVLFNLAVLYCQLAFHANKATEDGLKVASNYFCQSAGVISHIKSEVIPEMRSVAPEDMEPLTMECLEQLQLAQAQECYWQKAIKGGLKDATIAKLASKVSDLYAQAYEYGTKSNIISSEWIHHMGAKQHHFAAAAQFRAASDCLEKRKYGEEIARLRDSVTCVTMALKESRYVNKVVVADLNGLKAKVEDDLKRAEKDNDLIYLNTVPPKSELRTLERASMVSAKIPKEISEPLSFLGDRGELGQPLFSKLVPYSVHVAASIYASRRDQTVNSIVEDLDNLTSRIHSLLQSLNLPGSLQALEKPLGLPPGLVSHAEEIRQQNGPSRLKQAMEDVSKLKANNQASYQRGVNVLEQESVEDEQSRRRFGTDRWTRPTSAVAGKKLHDSVKQIREYFKGAEDSDALIRQRVSDNKPLIEKLNNPDKSLEEYVPSSRRVVITPSVDREVNKLRTALNDVTRLEGQRKRKVASLRAKAQADDVNSELLKEAARLERALPMQKLEAVQFEDFFDKRLQRYETDKKIVEDERKEQAQLLSRVAEANTSFNTARRGDNSTKDRERALQDLENAYFAYKEIIQNLDVGRKFYNELATITSKFEDDCRRFAYERRTEAAQLDSDLTTALPMSNLNLGQPQPISSRAPHPVQSVQSPRQESPYHEAARDEAPLAAPVPVKPQSAAPVANMTDPTSRTVDTTWKEGMGIKFAGVTTPHGNQPNNNGKAESGQNRGQSTTWNPNQGLNFK